MTRENFIEKIVDLGYKWQEGKCPSGKYKGEQGYFIKNDNLTLHFAFKGIEKMDKATFKKAVPNVYHMTRIVGYYSQVHNWNKSKLGELKDRQKGNYGMGRSTGPGSRVTKVVQSTDAGESKERESKEVEP